MENEDMSQVRQEIDDNSLLSAVLHIRNETKRSSYSSIVYYEPDDVVQVRILIRNRSVQEATYISVSHMIRDHLLYVPDTLCASRGEASIIFQLVRLRLLSLPPHEEAVLTFRVKAQTEALLPLIHITAAYTFRMSDAVQGPYQTIGTLMGNDL